MPSINRRGKQRGKIEKATIEERVLHGPNRGMEAARKRPGFVTPEAAGAELSRWNDQTGKNHGEKGCFRLNQVKSSVYNTIPDNSNTLQASLES